MTESKNKPEGKTMSFIWGCLFSLVALFLILDIITKGVLHKLIWVLILALINYITTGDSGLH